MTNAAPPELVEGIKQGKQEDMDKLMDMQAAEHFGGEWAQSDGQNKTRWKILMSEWMMRDTALRITADVQATYTLPS